MPDQLDPRLAFNAAIALAMVALQLGVIIVSVSAAGLGRRLPFLALGGLVTAGIAAAVAVGGPGLVFSPIALAVLVADIGWVRLLSRPWQGDADARGPRRGRVLIMWLVFVLGTVGLAFLIAAYSPAASGPA
jgi:hypothetical protein